MAEPFINGFWFPEGGMAAHPFGGQLVEGVQAWPTNDGALRWYVQVGTPAWDRWQAQSVVIQPVGPRIPKIVGLGRETNVLVGPWQGSQIVEADPVELETGEGDPVNQYANDPDLGVVPVGVPTNQGTLARIWSTPARLVARLLPTGAVSPAVATAVNLTPWALWLLLVWWLWRKAKK